MKQHLTLLITCGLVASCGDAVNTADFDANVERAALITVVDYIGTEGALHTYRFDSRLLSASNPELMSQHSVQHLALPVSDVMMYVRDNNQINLIDAAVWDGASTLVSLYEPILESVKGTVYAAFKMRTSTGFSVAYEAYHLERRGEEWTVTSKSSAGVDN